MKRNLIGASGRATRSCQMRWKVGTETPCHTTPATIITRMNATTSFARRLSFCVSVSDIARPPFFGQVWLIRVWRIVRRGIIAGVSIRPVGRGCGAIPIGPPRRAAGDPGEGQRREGHTDDVDENRGRPVGACQVTLQHAHIEGQLVAFEMRAPQLDNDIVGGSAVLAEDGYGGVRS